MATLLHDVIDRSRVRNRMGLDAGEQARMIKSELENYSEYFSPAEIKRLKNIRKELKRLHRSCIG